ncbi:MAG: hypothetical protein Q4D98_06670 [Planctomycetia bacterium]|nr:hypothetical protein [Planctomycetia bacterium]
MPKNSRRDVLKKMVGLPILGSVGSVSVVRSFEEICLAEATSEGAAAEKAPDGTTAATRKTFTPPPRPKLKEKVPMSQIKDVPVSRMFLGGNLIGGWAHARDMIYASDLVKAYHTEEKVYETFWLAEQCGINLFLGHYSLFQMVSGYWKYTPGKMKFFADCSTTNPDVIRKIVDDGAAGIYIQGETNDRLVREGKFDELEKTFTLMKSLGVPVGLGAHRIHTIKTCVEKGFLPDFWMKTYHHHDYPSARQAKAASSYEYYSIFCHEPEETRKFMETRPEPWIAFKVLAAGAIRPESGFRYAFEGGADFLCVGTYDFQVVPNVNTVVGILNGDLSKRTRPWCTETLDRKALLKAEREAKKQALQEKQDG